MTKSKRYEEEQQEEEEEEENTRIMCPNVRWV